MPAGLVVLARYQVTHSTMRMLQLSAAVQAKHMLSGQAYLAKPTIATN